METVSLILTVVMILAGLYFLVRPLLGMSSHAGNSGRGSINLLRDRWQEYRRRESLGVALLDTVGFVSLLHLYSKISEYEYNEVAAIVIIGFLIGLLIFPSLTRVAVSLCALFVLIPQTGIPGIAVISALIFLIIRLILTRVFGLR